MALGMTLKFYTSVAKGLKLKVKSQKAFEAKSYICRSYRGKTGRGPSWDITVKKRQTSVLPNYLHLRHVGSEYFSRSITNDNEDPLIH